MLWNEAEPEGGVYGEEWMRLPSTAGVLWRHSGLVWGPWARMYCHVLSNLAISALALLQTNVWDPTFILKPEVSRMLMPECLLMFWLLLIFAGIVFILWKLLCDLSSICLKPVLKNLSISGNILLENHLRDTIYAFNLTVFLFLICWDPTQGFRIHYTGVYYVLGPQQN